MLQWMRFFRQQEVTVLPKILLKTKVKTSQDVEGEYSNSTVTDLDLHMIGNEQGVEERKDTKDNSF